MNTVNNLKNTTNKEYSEKSTVKTELLTRQEQKKRKPYYRKLTSHEINVVCSHPR